MNNTKTITLETNPVKSKQISSSTEQISLYELCRWASLKDAVDLLADKCEERKMKFEDVKLDPLAILKFVDSQSDQFYHNILQSQNKNYV